MKRIDETVEADPTVQRVVAQGYEIRFSFRPGNQFLDFKVFRGGKPVAHATFSVIPSHQEIQAEQVSVYEGHTRHGVGNAIYVCAKKLTGYTAIPAANQTEDGRLFWDQPNRPW
jgi:hypothetical protein